MLKNDQLDRWDRDYLLHPSTHLAQHARGESPSRIVTGGSGVWIEDRDGNRLLDAFAGLYCVNAGYGRTEIADAIAAQATRARLLPRLCRPRHRARDHAGEDDPGARPEGHVPGLLRPRRLRRQRDQRQARLVHEQRPRPPGEEEDHLPLARLSRLRPRHRLADRPRALPQEVRPAARPHPAHRGPLLLPPPRPRDGRARLRRPLRRRARGADRPRRRRHHRRLHRRAGARHRRHRAAARRLLAGDPGGAPPPRHPA